MNHKLVFNVNSTVYCGLKVITRNVYLSHSLSPPLSLSPSLPPSLSPSFSSLSLHTVHTATVSSSNYKKAKCTQLRLLSLSLSLCPVISNLFKYHIKLQPVVIAMTTVSMNLLTRQMYMYKINKQKLVRDGHFTLGHFMCMYYKMGI